MAAAVAPTYTASYSYQKQPYLVSPPRSAMLAGLKFCLYNPQLPTLRKMDRDDVIQKLPCQHSRTTTPCSNDFRRYSGDQHHDKVGTVPMKGMYLPNASSKTRYTEDWSAVLKAMLNARKRNLEDDKYGRTPIDSSQMPFKISSSVVRRPMAATMYSRYRSSSFRPLQVHYQKPWK